MRSGLMLSGCWTEDLCKSLSVHFHVYAVLSAGVLTAPYKRVRPRVAGLLFMMPMVRKFLNRPASACAMFFKDFYLGSLNLLCHCSIHNLT